MSTPMEVQPSRAAGGGPAALPPRRSLLRGAVALGGLALAGSVSGCSNALSAGLAGTELDPGTVTFWNLFGGGDGARLQTMLQRYAKAHGGASSLQAATFAWGNPYYTKLSLATIGKKPPDVAVAHLTRMKNLAAADLLTPITEEVLGVVGLSSSDFTPKVWSSGTFKGSNWAVPLDTHPLVMFYNADVCAKAGLLDAAGKLKPIVGVDAWQSALQAAKKVTGAYGVTVANVNETATPWRFFQSLYHQRDGVTPFLGAGGMKLTVDEDAAIATLEFMQKMSTDGLQPKAADYAGAQTLMFTGKSAFYLEGEWEITTAQAVKGLKFGIVPVPQIFDKPAVQADSHMFVLPKMDRDSGQLKRAMGFVKSMLDQSMTWAQGGHIPAYLPTLHSAAYGALEPQADYASAASVAVYDDPAWYSGSGSTFETIVGAQIGLVQQGITSPQQAMSSIKSQLATYLDTPSPL